ncbi:hypothetical protein D8I24_4543 [Cupriavidus necator H850]|nr:hypothetical protein D8I24_4543 [Cupriavidus necator H850]
MCRNFIVPTALLSRARLRGKPAEETMPKPDSRCSEKFNN